MLKRCVHILIMFILLISNVNIAMAQDRNSLRITHDNLFLQFDLKSGRPTLDSILNLAGLSPQAADKISRGDFSPLTKDGWTLANKQGSFVSYQKSLNVLNENPQSNPYEITMRMPQLEGKPGYPGDVKYGVNKFAKITVFELPSGMTRFILPGFERRKRVLLSGNFNGWSTLKGIMKKTDGGWMLDLKLEPGAYEYKYIIDGRWDIDHDNLIRTEDGAGNTNSVYYKYNYTFKLKGYPEARRIMLAGDFNNWDANELVMDDINGVWEKQLYLNEGKHSYRFLVDGTWITDPANPAKEKDNKGNLNSIIPIGETVHFKLKGYADAKKIFVAGDFNDWQPEELPLKRHEDIWSTQLILPAGNFAYRFIVDGKPVMDPANGSTITKNDETNSFIAVKPNYTFTLKGHAKAHTVKLSGTFNHWDTNGYTMARKGDEWVISLNLKPGKYLYKFIVDGNWIIDPGNKFWEDNEFHNGNSVLWIE